MLPGSVSRTVQSMGRGQNWRSEPPGWAWVVMVVGVIVLAVVIPMGAAKGRLSPAEYAREKAAAAASPAPTTAPAVTLPKTVRSVVVIGDSYTDRNRAPERQVYSDQLAALMGWPTPEVLSTSGGGYMSPGAHGTFLTLLPQAKATAPDVVIVEGGRNDYKWDALRTGVVKTLTAVRDRWPNATLIVPGILWPAPVPAEVTKADAAIVGTAQQFDKTIAVDLIANRFVYQLGPDHTHPDAVGDRQLAEALRAALQRTS